jgi:hypothetical protein
LLDLAFREEGEVKKHVSREKSFFKKWEATRKEEKKTHTRQFYSVGRA